MANEAYFPGIPETDKVKNSQYVIINNEKTGKPDKIRLDKFITNLNLTTDTTPTNNITSVTYSEAQTLITNSGLIAGEHYLISDKADAGIILLAVSTNQFSLEGQGIFLNPDFQNVYGSNVGVWHSGLVGLVLGTSVVIWDGLHYESVTGAVGTAPSGDVVNWVLVPKSAADYIEEVDFILYDFDNDAIFERHDKRGNKWNPSYITSFQAGNDQTLGNVVSHQSDVNIINQRGLITNNTFAGTNNGYLIADNNFTGFFRNNYLKDTNITIEGTATVEVCNIQLTSGSIVFETGVLHQNKTINDLGSTFEADLDMDDAAIYTANQLTIPTTLNYIGIFTLRNNGAVTIDKITNLPSTHKVRFYVQAGNSKLFSHTTITNPAVDLLVSDAAAINIIVGRADGSDFIEYELSGRKNRRYNAVIAA